MDIGFLACDNKWAPTILRHAFANSDGLTSISPFRNLSHITFTLSLEDMNEVACSVSTKVVLRFLDLQSLRSLEIWAMQELTDVDLSKADLPIRPLTEVHVPSAVHTLRLYRSMASPKTLSVLLKKCPNLKTLLYDRYLSYDSTPLDLGVLGKALRRVRSTLTNLTICYDCFDEPLIGYDTSFDETLLRGHLGSFHSFSALTDLCISIDVLLGHESYPAPPSLASFLPPCLQRLTISDDLWDFEISYSFGESSLLKTLYTDFLNAAPGGLENCDT